MGFKIKNKKVFRSVLIIICVVLLISVTVWVFYNRHQRELALQIKDLNGDDKSLCVITDDDIKQKTQDYRAIKRKVSSEGTHSSGLTGYFEECDNDHTKTRIGSLSGIYVCNAVVGNGQKIQYTIDSQVHSGNFQIVITDADNTILFDVPIDSKETVTFQTEQAKIYYVKFIAESAKFDAELWRQFPD